MSTSIVQPTALLPPIVDGFLYNLYTRYWDTRFMPLVLAQYETLRRAKTFRFHQYVVPDEQHRVIKAYDTFEMQVAIVAGSFWYGTTFVAMDPTSFASVDPHHNWLIRIRESANDIGACEDFIYAEAFSVFNSPVQEMPILNSTPRPIVEPALINVEICNDSGNGSTARDLPCQLVLWCAEPCQMPTGPLTECAP